MSKSKKETSKKVEEREPEIKRQAVFELQLSRFELLHLRDLMSILLPPNGEQTLSQALAAVEDRNLIESILWEKMSALCSEAGLPLNGEAPDYIVAPTSPPPMGVFQINQDLQSGTTQVAGFLPNDEEVDQEKEE
ncbi:MAG: hypothetical protein FJZ60_00110 [Chlamydiae bacterium]|nr:hypothetical protein [Chlamydiota bacterium]